MISDRLMRFLATLREAPGAIRASVTVKSQLCGGARATLVSKIHQNSNQITPRYAYATSKGCQLPS
jgi:hypothetical protein